MKILKHLDLGADPQSALYIHTHIPLSFLTSAAIAKHSLTAVSFSPENEKPPTTLNIRKDKTQSLQHPQQPNLVLNTHIS